MYNKKGFKKSKVRNYRKPKVNLKKLIQNQIDKNIETKELTYPYSNIGGTSLVSIGYGSSSKVVGFFGAIAQGTGDGNRIGNALFARGININLAFAGNTSAITNYLRIIIFQAKKTMATNVQPSVTGTFVQSVLSNNGSSVLQWLQPVDTDRFDVLLDKKMWFRNQPVDGNSSTVISNTKFFNKFIKINRKMQWDDSNVINNDVYMIAISDSALYTPSTLAGFVRVYYKDA